MIIKSRFGHHPQVEKFIEMKVDQEPQGESRGKGTNHRVERIQFWGYKLIGIRYLVLGSMYSNHETIADLTVIVMWIVHPGPLKKLPVRTEWQHQQEKNKYYFIPV